MTYTRTQFPPSPGSRYNRAHPARPTVRRRLKQRPGTPANVAACLQSRRNARLFNEVYPQPPQEDRRSTYLLNREELESLANELFAAGWAIWEVLERLDIQPPDKQ